jgi:hypothetical protein
MKDKQAVDRNGLTAEMPQFLSIPVSKPIYLLLSATKTWQNIKLKLTTAL